MANARISVRNFIDDSTDIAVSPSAASTLPITNVQSTPRDRVYRSTSNHTVTITGTWGGAGRRPNCFGMFRHNGHGGQVRVQLYSDTALSASIYDSGTVDIFTLVTLGSMDWGIDPLGLSSTDVLGNRAPYILFFTASATAALGYKITLTNCSAAYWEIGRIWLGTYLEFTYNASMVELAPRENTDSVRARGGSNRSRLGESWREMALEFDYITTTQRPYVLDAVTQAGTGRDLVLSFFPGAGGRDERDYTINGKFASLDSLKWQALQRSISLQLTEN